MDVFVMLNEWRILDEEIKACKPFSDATFVQVKMGEDITDGIFVIEILLNVPLVDEEGELHVYLNADVDEGFMYLIDNKDEKLRSQALNLLMWEATVSDRHAIAKDNNPKIRQKMPTHVRTVQ